MRKLVLCALLFAVLPALADVFADGDDEKLEGIVQQGVRTHFSTRNSFYSGPRGLLLFDNCEQVILEDHRSGDFPREFGARFSVPVKLFFKKDKKTDSVEAQVQIEVKEKGLFRVLSVDVPADQVSPVDPCDGLRGNSRLLASVRHRELLLGMPEKAVLASWGAPARREVMADGSVRLEYELRSVRLAGGIVQGWDRLPSKK